jgi:hypothetical protein
MARPTRLSQLEKKGITLKDIEKICLDYANKGYFWHEMPLAIYDELGESVCFEWMSRLDDEDFKKVKKLCFAAMTRFYTLRLMFDSLPSTPWIFIMKNCGGWRDHRDIKIEAPIKIDSNKELDEKELKEIEGLIKEIGQAGE